MRLRIAHRIVHRYEPPAAGVIQVLRLTPRNHEGQYVIGWHIDVSGDARLNAHEDAFGNLTHVFAADGPFAELSISVEGEIESQNTDGIVRGTLERFPPSLFLRNTPWTQADAALRDYARELSGGTGGDTLAVLHALLDGLHSDMVCEDGVATSTPATAAETFARRRGTPRDLTQMFLAGARSLDIPARYIAGYCRQQGESDGGGHSWAEAYVAGLGWVGFDPALGISPTDAHVRVAVGLDALGAAPVRGTRLGAGAESLAVAVSVDQ